MFRSDLAEKFSGWSGKNCELCGKEITVAALNYSLKHYGKILCRTCQSLEEYKLKRKRKVNN